MLIRGQTTEDRIREIAQGFGQGVQNFQQGQDRQRSQSLQDEALRRQQAMQSFEVENKLSEQTGRQVQSGTGAAILSGNGGNVWESLKNAPMTPKYEAAQKKLERENLKHQREMEKLEKERLEESLPFEQTRGFKEKAALAEIRNNGAQGMYYARQQADTNKKLQMAAVPGFKIANPLIVPTQKDAEEIKKYHDSNKNFQDVGKSLLLKISSLKPSDRTGLTNNWKMIEQDLTQMGLQGKELANLGALTGPDLELMNKDLGSISLTSINTIGAKGAMQRIRATLDRANAKLRNKASSRGYIPEEEIASPEAEKDAKMQRLIELRARKAGN